MKTRFKMAASSFPRSHARCLRGHAHFRLLRHSHGWFGQSAFLRCPEAALQRVGSGWQPVETPTGPGCQPFRPWAPHGAPRLVLCGWPPCSPNERPTSKKNPKGKFCKTSCTAVTGNGCWNTGMAAQTAEVAGRRKETEKCS